MTRRGLVKFGWSDVMSEDLESYITDRENPELASAVVSGAGAVCNNCSKKNWSADRSALILSLYCFRRGKQGCRRAFAARGQRFFVLACW